MQQEKTRIGGLVISQDSAERIAIRGLLNSYIREAGQLHFIVSEEGIGEGTQAQVRAFTLFMPLTGQQLTGSLVYYSTIGLHEYGQSFYGKEQGGTPCLLDTSQLVQMLLKELSLGKGKQEADKQSVQGPQREMEEQIRNSIQKMSLYIQHAIQEGEQTQQKPLTFISSEQSVLAGHPFHPLPKSSEGFTQDDLMRFAPELKVAFQLHYMAVSYDVLKEEWLGEDKFTPAAVTEEAYVQLGGMAEHYTLLPLHPWQAKYLLGKQKVRELIGNEKLIDLGPLGAVVYPTASVRTVWVPESGCFIKLPLHIRITNLIRENTQEHTQRTLDAAKVIDHISDEIETEHFRVLKERGYRTVLAGGDEADSLSSSFGVFYREAEGFGEEEQRHSFVLAALLECPPGETEARLIQAIRQTNHGLVPDLYVWLRYYLQISMLPMLHQMDEQGISYEAHVQNSLVSIKRGYPVCFYLRDLEGMSIDRRIASVRGWLDHVIAGDSPLLYSEDEAWMRTKYYFFVNHLGALIHTLARFQQVSEDSFWHVVTDMLVQEKERAALTNPRLYSSAQDLLTGSTLPAKANFISRFRGHGETPIFISIPNPMRISEV